MLEIFRAICITSLGGELSRCSFYHEIYCFLSSFFSKTDSGFSIFGDGKTMSLFYSKPLSSKLD